MDLVMFLLNFFLLSFIFVVAKSDKHHSCLEEGINTQGRQQLGDPVKADSWGECAEKCATNARCSYWTWAHGGAGPYAFNCALMAKFSKKVRDDNTFSGPKACQEVFYTRYGKECEDKCKCEDSHNPTKCQSLKSFFSKCSVCLCKVKGTNDEDFCSTNSVSTVHQKDCKEGCSQSQGDQTEKYFWCHEKDGSWDYCSPPAKSALTWKYSDKKPLPSV